VFEKIKNAFKIKDIRKKMFWTLLLIIVYRIGCYIPVPGIMAEEFSKSVSGGFLDIMSAITGGALSHGTLFAMGIGPYINASIIIQLLTIGIPALEKLSKQGEEGRKKIEQLTRYITIVLAIVQALGILLNSSNAIDFTLLGLPESFGWVTYVYMVILYTAGAALTMWIGERITENGIGNGISLLIFVGILSTAATALQYQILSIGTNQFAIWGLLGFIVAVIVIFACIVYVDLAERRVPVEYAKQIKGRKMYGGQSSHIPIRVNANGVLPLIFAFALISFPDLIMSLFWPDSGARKWYGEYMGAGSWSYMVVLSLLILVFAFFYTQVQFNAEDISKNIQGNGGFVPGIRPGQPTTQYLKKISNRITLFGAIFLALVALLPTVIFKSIPGNVALLNAFSATGLLIVVSVALEFDKQLEGQIMMKHYKGFLK